MGKLLFWVVLVALAWMAYRLFVISQRRREAAERRAQDAAGAPRPEERMVRCSHCGVFLPSSDALIEGDRAWCDRAHRQADRSGQARE
jgi:uncharacterized protein